MGIVASEDSILDDELFEVMENCRHYFAPRPLDYENYIDKDNRWNVSLLFLFRDKKKLSLIKRSSTKEICYYLDKCHEEICLLSRLEIKKFIKFIVFPYLNTYRWLYSRNGECRSSLEIVYNIAIFLNDKEIFSLLLENINKCKEEYLVIIRDIIEFLSRLIKEPKTTYCFFQRLQFIHSFGGIPATSEQHGLSLLSAHLSTFDEFASRFFLTGKYQTWSRNDGLVPV